jgi:protein phosphatase PTC1
VVERVPTTGSFNETVVTDATTEIGTSSGHGPSHKRSGQPSSSHRKAAGSRFIEAPHSPFTLDGVAVANAPSLPAPALSEANDPNPVWRPTDEDSHVHGQLRVGGMAPRDYYFFAVFDGHGGGATSKFISKHIWAHLASRMASPDPIEHSITAAFFDADEHLIKGCQHGNSGSTSAVVLLTSGQQSSEWSLTVANCGDTRVVLSARNRVVRLSTDHSPAVPAERERIEKSGGWVSSDRIIGVLAVSRAFGNFEMKELCPPTPTVAQVVLRGKPKYRWSRFVIIACDGLWDVMTDEEAVETVKTTAERNSSRGVDDPLEDAARVLVDEALDRGTTDNVTVQVVFF